MEATATAGSSRAPKSDEIRAACPIADALGPIHRQRPGTDAAAAETRRVDAIETLATLLDLTGSMTLAVQLESAARLEPIAPATLLPATDLAALIRDRADLLATAVDRRLAELPTSRSAIWGAARMTDEITSRGLAGAKRGRGAAALARESSDSYGLAIRGLLDRIRGDLRGLRAELGPRLALRGSRVARLEAFDALVGRARAAATHRLIGRIPSALIDDFGLRLELALQALDASHAGAAIASWYGPDGFITQFHADTGRVVRGVFEHDRIALLELVAAARILESDSSPDRASDAGASGEATPQSDSGRARH